MPGQRQRRQPQPGRPPLGPLHAAAPAPASASSTPAVANNARASATAEPQILGADLGQPTLQPQPVQPQPQVMPGGQHEPQRMPGPASSAAPAAAGPGRAQLVQVVDDQPEPAPAAAPGPSAAAPRSPTRPGPAPPSAPAPAPTPGPSGAARPAPTARTAAGPARPAPPAPRRPGRPGPPAPIHDRSSTVFPLPAGADTTVTRAGVPSRSGQPETRNDSSRTGGDSGNGTGLRLPGRPHRPIITRTPAASSRETLRQRPVRNRGGRSAAVHPVR